MKNSGPHTGRLGPRPGVPRREPELPPSRARLLEVLQSRSEPATITALAAATGLHPNTVRQHLEALEGHGLVARAKASAGGRGRPAWLYSAPGPVSAPRSEYAGLAATLAAAISHTSEHPRQDAVAAGTDWGRELARDHGRPPRRGRAAARREVLTLLDELGFAPEREPRTSGVRLTRCPLLDAAHQYPEVVCGVHLGIVRGALQEYDTDPTGTELLPFAEPGACLLRLGHA